MIKKSTAIRFLILVLLTITLILILKINPQLKTNFYKITYEKNLSFATINNWYKEKFGSPLPFSDYLEETIPVFNETLKYSEANKYKDGVKLEVGIDYLVPALDDGIVVFIGEKTGYGKTVIVQQSDGIDVWYSNLQEININLYDYIKKGSLIGTVNNQLYLVFIKDGDILDYKEHI